MTSTDRLATLVRHLHDGAWTRADELAEKLGVSTRTVYRDVRALHRAGVPLRAAPGHGYKLPDGSALPPVLLHRDEAALLLAGADHVESHVDVRYRTAAQAARQKIEALLAGDAEAEAFRTALRLAPANAFDAPEARLALATIHGAVEARQALRVVRDGATATLHPYALARRSGTWWLVARDTATGQVTTYRADRLLAPEPLAESFERPAAYTTPPGGETRDVEIQVHFDRVAARWLASHPAPYLDAFEAGPQGARATLRVRRFEEALPYLLGWGAHVQVLDPPALQEMLRREAERVARLYTTFSPGLFG